VDNSIAQALESQAVNFAFGGPDLRTLFCCAHTSVYTLRVKVPRNPHSWYKRRGQ
jgi:gluconolactonase